MTPWVFSAIVVVTAIWWRRHTRPMHRRPADRRHSRKYMRAINSPHWRRLKRRMRERTGYRCQDCGRREDRRNPLFLHHLHYDTLGHERPCDVRLLCRPCHDAADLVRAARSRVA